MRQDCLPGRKQRTSSRLRLLCGTLAVAMLFFVTLAPAQGDKEESPVVVGVYENPPLVFTNADGVPSGLFITLLKDWADNEKLKLQYKHGSLDEVLNLVASGKVDVVPAICPGDKLSDQLTFPRNYVVENWAWLYVRLNSPIRDFHDLTGKRVAGASGDPYFKEFEGMMRDMRVQTQLATYPTREDALQAVASGQADAAVTDRLAGQSLLAKLEMQDVLRVRCGHFAEKRLTFGVRKKASPTLAGRLDAYLGEAKTDPDSIYYSAINSLFVAGESKPPAGYVPAYIFWVIAGLAVGLLAAWGFNALLRREVTQRTRELRESEQKYRHLFDGLNEPALLAEADTGYIVDVNPQASVLTGLPRKELVGLHFSQVNPSGKTEFHKGKFQEVVETGGPVDYDSEFVRPDGRIVPVEVNARIVDAFGRKCVMVLCRDLTELQKAEDALKASEARYRSIFETAGSLIVCMDINGTVRDCNSRIEEFTGYTRDEVVGRSLFKFVHPDFQKQAQESLHEVMVQGSTRNHEYRLIRKDSSAVHARINSAALRNDKGEFTEVVLIMNDITAIKRTQDALRESEARFRRFAESSVEGIVFHDKGVILDANASFARMFGYGFDEVAGKHVLDFAAPESRELIAGNVRSGYEEPYEAVGMRKDGSRIFGELCGRAVPYKGRTVRVTVVRDLSERKKAEQALRESERKLSTLMSNLPGMAYRCRNDRDWTMEFVSDGCVELTGHAPADLVNNRKVPFNDLIHPDDREYAWEEVQACLQRRTPYRLTYRIMTAAGEEKWVWEKGCGVWGDASEVLALEGFIADITDRKHAEEAVRQERDRAQQYLDIAQVMLVAINTDGEITLINHEGCRVLGYEEHELIGKSWFDTCLPHHVRGEMRNFFDAFVRGEMIEDEGLEYEYPVLTKAGEERVIEWRNVLVRDEEGNAVGTLSSGEDITAQRKTEKALLRREEQLRQAAKMESIGRLAGGVAHEFNNLLTGIIGFTEFALDSLPSEHTAVRDLVHVQKLADRAANLTKQLLAFGRGQRLQTVVLNPNGLVDEMSKMLRHLIGEDIELIITKDPDLGNVRADPGQIEQVLMNLAINAREAMPQGGRLTIETASVVLDESYAHAHVDAQPGPHVMLAIADTGHGMDKETLQHVFEPFFTTKKELGMGLGLATVYGIIRQHGGSIAVISERGKGTAFKIYLPRVDEAAEPLPAAPTEAPAGSETILIVEDEDSVLELARTTLARSGYNVLCAASTGEAEQVVAKHGPDIAMVLTDVVMPDGNGYELYARLVSRHPSLKVLYMSGYTADHLNPNASEGSRVPFIMKPFAPATLASEVRKVLDETE